jgi:hypothetical protein
MRLILVAANAILANAELATISEPHRVSGCASNWMSFRDEDFGLAVGLDSGEAGGGSVA